MIIDTALSAILLVIDMIFAVIKLPPVPPEFVAIMDAVLGFASEGFSFIVMSLGRNFSAVIFSAVAMSIITERSIALGRFLLAKFPMLNIR